MREFWCGFAALAITAAAQQPLATDVRFPDIVVTATRVPQHGFDVPAAIDTVDERVIRDDRPQVNLSEVLNRVPGIAVLNRQNYAQDLQISSRGFGSRTTFGVRGVRLFTDGIPATMPDGQGQAASFVLSSAERIEVLRGPFSSLYGNSSGGVIQIFTADGPPEPTASGAIVVGSDRTWKAGGQLGGTTGVLNYVADISRFETDGYRDHSAAMRDQLNAKLKLPLRNLRLTLLLSALEQPQTQDPLGLSRSQLEANPRQVDPSAITFNTRKSIRQKQAGLVVDAEATPADALQGRIYSGTRSVLQYLAQTGDTPLGSGGVVDLDREYAGAGLRWTRSLGPADAPLTFSLGMEADRMKEHRRGFVNANGVAGALRRDEDDTVTDRDLYGQAQWQLSPRWSVHIGARYSHVGFDSRDHYVTALNPDDSGALSYSHTTPVAGIVFKASPQLNLYLNAGEGFETPTFAELAYRPGGATGLNFGLRPATSRHVEAGAKARFAGNARLNVAAFHIETSDEIVTNTSSGGRTDFKNASKTRRDGFELSHAAVLGGGIETNLAYTWLDARFTEPFTSGTPPVAISAGAKLPGVPRSVLDAELVWRHAASGAHAAIELRASSKIYVNEANSESAGGYGIANARAGVEGRMNGWQFKSFARVDNLANRRYAGSVIVAEARGRFYEPAPGRTYLVGITATGP